MHVGYVTAAYNDMKAARVHWVGHNTKVRLTPPSGGGGGQASAGRWPSSSEALPGSGWRRRTAPQIVKTLN